MNKIHCSGGIGRQTLCIGLNMRVERGDAIVETTNDPAKVTCRRCLNILEGKPNGHPIKPRTPWYEKVLK